MKKQSLKPELLDDILKETEGANFKTSPFAQYLRQAQILILENLNVFLWLKFSPSLILNKIEHFETASEELRFSLRVSKRLKRNINRC